MLTNIAMYYYTIKDLKLIQIYGQIIFRIKKSNINFALSTPNRNPILSAWTAPIIKHSMFSFQNTLTILNQKKDDKED